MGTGLRCGKFQRLSPWPCDNHWQKLLCASGVMETFSVETWRFPLPHKLHSGEPHHSNPWVLLLVCSQNHMVSSPSSDQLVCGMGYLSCDRLYRLAQGQHFCSPCYRFALDLHPYYIEHTPLPAERKDLSLVCKVMSAVLGDSAVFLVALPMMSANQNLVFWKKG